MQLLGMNGMSSAKPSQATRFGAVEVLQYGAEHPGILVVQLSDGDKVPGFSDILEFSANAKKNDADPADVMLSQRKDRDSASTKAQLLNPSQLKKIFKPLLHKILKKEYVLSKTPWAGIPVKSTDLPSRGIPKWPRPDAAADIQDNALYFLYELMKREPKPATDKPA